MSNVPPLLTPTLVDPGLAMAASNGRLSFLRRLVVSYCPGVGDNGLRAVLDRCLALRELAAGGCAEVGSASFFSSKPHPDTDIR